MKRLFQHKFVLSLLFATVILPGCGGGGGASSSTTTLTGNAAKGTIANGLVEVFEVVNGTVGAKAIASGITDASGDFSLTVPTTSNPVVIKVSRKDATTTMLDEISEQREAMPIDFELRSFADDLTVTRVATVNPYTDLAISKLPAGQLTQAAVAQSATWVKDNYLGGEVDPFKVAPAKGTSATVEQKILYARLSEIAAMKADTACTGKTGGEALACAVTIVRDSASFTVTNGQVVPSRDTNKIAKLNNAPALPQGLQSALGSAVNRPSSLGVLANPNAAIPAVISPTEATAATFANDLSEASRKFRKFSKESGKKVSELSDLAFGAAEGESYLTNSISKYCPYNSSAQQFTCVSEVAWDTGRILGFAAPSDYKLKLTGQPNNYAYTISGPSSANYTGEITFNAAAKTIDLKGKVPEFYRVAGQNKVRSADLSVSWAASLLDVAQATDGSLLSGSVTYSYSASANTDLKASAITLSANLSGTYKKDIGIEGVAIKGTLSLNADGNTFSGEIAASSKVYPVNDINKLRKDDAEKITLKGTFALKSGETIVGSLTAIPDFSKVDFARDTSASNFGTGSISASLEAYDLSKNNYAVLTIDLARTEFSKGSNLIKMRVGTDSEKRWIAFNSEVVIDTSDKNNYLPLKTIESNDDSWKITSAAGFGGKYMVKSRATDTDGIKNKDGVKVGRISNGQLFIGGSVSPILFE